FPRILSWNRGSGGERIIFARGDLDLRINQWIKLTDVSPTAETTESAEQLEEKAPNRDLHPRPELSVPYAAPTDEIEESLAILWQEFFGIDTIGIDDDFFALGGDSLKAIIILERISKKLAARITVADFFDAPTIRGVAVHVRKAADSISQPVEQNPTPGIPDHAPVIPQAKIYREEEGDFEF
ncbi:MAG: phosphopantetheine-binding protein, partial [Acidobacteria bacterium]|nr:phosphopantetheine-binding protein [Acidobacteriota bacterium]